MQENSLQGIKKNIFLFMLTVITFDLKYNSYQMSKSSFTIALGTDI